MKLRRFLGRLVLVGLLVLVAAIIYLAYDVATSIKNADVSIAPWAGG